MRALLLEAFLLGAQGHALANDLDDLPALACAQASSDLERKHIGCALEVPDAPND